MNKEEVIEGNRLIAEFMKAVHDSMTGYWFYIPKECIKYRTSILAPTTKELEFHSSWNWLMPVINKLKEVTEEPEDLDPLKEVLWWGNIEDVFQEVVQQIKWYNTQKQ